MSYLGLILLLSSFPAAILAFWLTAAFAGFVVALLEPVIGLALSEIICFPLLIVAIANGLWTLGNFGSWAKALVGAA